MPIVWGIVASSVVTLIVGLLIGRLKGGRFKTYRDIALAASAGLGYLALFLSFLFASPYVTWESFFGLLMAFQSQLSLIYYRLGEIKGVLKGQD